MEQKVKSTLDAVCFVYTTADMWKAHNKSFFSMTIHWIDTNTLEHCKAAISCSRLIGCHIYDVLASKIESIYRSYNLNGKVTTTVTDNELKFVKAFKTFCVTNSSSTEVVQEDLSPGEDCADEQETSFEDVHTTLILDNTNDLTQVEYDLPIQQRCAAHTMNLVASSDITKPLSTSREALSRELLENHVQKKLFCQMQCPMEQCPMEQSQLLHTGIG